MVAVRKSLLGGDDDRFTGMDSHRVDVFHRADDDAVVSRVSHHLVLVLLPAENALFDEHLTDL